MLFALGVVQGTVSLFLDVLMFAMFARAIISWLPGLSDSHLGEFLFPVTDWVITPVRALFERMHWDAPMMIDLPFFVTFMLLSIVSSII